MPFGIRRFSNVEAGLLHLEDAEKPHPLEEAVVERLPHVEGFRIPPRPAAVDRALPCSFGAYAPSDQISLSRPRVLPRNPYGLAQMSSDVSV